ncbi:MAG: hypothetical protein CMF42_04100 [Legionellales bacterium]|nr:hypothetical protein [Legionellales bacterium]OUX67526.1 MAG: hypothetical protein CBD38_02480 [bacterium TMED178]|tara:strand:- start:2164 stop:3327 length:1164 start_codon:yes stop_codon:yes gene_type:complete
MTLLRIFIMSMLSIVYSSNQVQIPTHSQDPLVRIGICDKSEPLVYIQNNKTQGDGNDQTYDHSIQTVSGLSVDLTNELLDAEFLDHYQKKYIIYSDHIQAKSDLEKNKIDILLGDFTSSIKVSQYSIPFFLDEIVILSFSKILSFNEIIKIIWNDLVQDILLFSIFLIILFSILLYYFENKVHPHMKDSSFIERLSYSFFMVTACFLRDLVYDPVTNTGRIIMGIWMIISLFLITIVTSVITSSVITLTHFNDSDLSDYRDLHQQRVGYVVYEPSQFEALKTISAIPIPYNDYQSLQKAIFNHEIYYAAVSKLIVTDLLKHEIIDRNQLSISNLVIGFESMSILISEKFGKKYSLPLKKSFDEIDANGKIFNLCQQYLDHPQNCNLH